MLDGRVLGASQVEYKPFGKPPLKRERGRELFKAVASQSGVAIFEPHQHKHASVAEVQGSLGQYLSTLTAEYPASLAARLIKHCVFKVSAQPEVRHLRKPSPLSLHPVRLRVGDGAGMHSTADHSIP